MLSMVFVFCCCFVSWAFSEQFFFFFFLALQVFYIYTMVSNLWFYGISALHCVGLCICMFLMLFPGFFVFVFIYLFCPIQICYFFIMFYCTHHYFSFFLFLFIFLDAWLFFNERDQGWVWICLGREMGMICEFLGEGKA